MKMKKNVFGYKSVIADTILSISIIVGSLQLQIGMAITIGLSLVCFFYGFFLYSVVIVDDTAISVRYLLNFFREKKTIKFGQIHSLKLVMNSIPLGMSSMRIQVEKKEIVLFNRLYKSELRKMANVLVENKVEVDLLLF